MRKTKAIIADASRPLQTQTPSRKSSRSKLSFVPAAMSHLTAGPGGGIAPGLVIKKHPLHSSHYVWICITCPFGMFCCPIWDTNKSEMWNLIILLIMWAGRLDQVNLKAAWFWSLKPHNQSGVFPKWSETENGWVERKPTGELRLPLGQALLLHGVQVRQVVVLRLQGVSVQAEGGQASGGVSAGEHAVRPVCRDAGHNHQ